MIQRNIVRAGVLAALALAALQNPAIAQVKLEANVSPMVTGTFFLGDPPGRFAIHRQEANELVVQEGRFDDAFGVGVNAGIRIADHFGIEGMVWWVPTKLTARSGLENYGNTTDVNALMYGSTFAYYFGGLGQVEPFVGIGIGGETMSYEPDLSWERHTDLMANGVVGANLWFAERLGIRFEARDCLTRFESEIQGVDNATENDLMLSVGLTLRAPFGQQR